MAGLVDTIIQDINAQYPNGLDRDEWKFTKNGLLAAGIEQTGHPSSIISPSIVELASKSDGMALKIPVIKYGDLTVSNQRSCTIGENENESAKVTVNWVRCVTGFSMMKAQHHSNEISYLHDFNKKLEKVQNAFGTYIENAIYTKLDTEKSKVFGSTLVGENKKYSLVSNAIQVSKANQELFFNDIDVIQNQDDFYSPEWLVVGSTPLMSTVRHYMNQGASNDKNTNYQFNDFKFRFSNQVVSGDGKIATGFMMPFGSYGILTKIGVDSLAGHEATDGTRWETTYLPRLGMEVGVMHKSSCADKSESQGLSHLDATMVEYFQFSFDFALLTPYNSNSATKAGSIKKFEFTAV